MEVIYDLDTVAAQVCNEEGINMVRAGTAGTHPKFIEMIAELVRERTQPGTPRRAEGTLGSRARRVPADLLCMGPPVRLRRHLLSRDCKGVPHGRCAWEGFGLIFPQPSCVSMTRPPLSIPFITPKTVQTAAGIGLESVHHHLGANACFHYPMSVICSHVRRRQSPPTIQTETSRRASSTVILRFLSIQCGSWSICRLFMATRSGLASARRRPNRL